MWCMKCNKDLSQCICGDIEERLNQVASGGNFAYKKCDKCGKHYSRCKCDKPEFVTVMRRGGVEENN